MLVRDEIFFGFFYHLFEIGGQAVKATKQKKLCFLILLCSIMLLGGCTAGFQNIAPAPDSHALRICRQEATYLFSNQEDFKRPSMLGVCIRY
jgi:hypothetical protein